MESRTGRVRSIFIKSDVFGIVVLRILYNSLIFCHVLISIVKCIFLIESIVRVFIKILRCQLDLDLNIANYYSLR